LSIVGSWNESLSVMVNKPVGVKVPAFPGNQNRIKKEDKLKEGGPGSRSS